MQPADPSWPARRPQRFDSTLVATYCGLFSALGYTAANICLRALTDCDAVWVSCVKAFPTVVLVAPWLCLRAARNQCLIPCWHVLGILVVAALVGQLGGNVLFQWSLGVVGIAMSVPLCLGSMILASVVVGRSFLGEVITRRMVVATVILLLAIAILSLGAVAANRSFGLPGPRAGHLVWVIIGVAAACFSGITYCLLGTVIRWSSNRGTPVSTILAVTCLVGMVSLGALSAVRIGPLGMVRTNRLDLVVMLLAGLCNAAAFLALTLALQLAGLVYVNALNASQTALAAVAGVVVFGEAVTPWLVLGVLLTAGGLLLMKGRGRAVQSAGLGTRRAEPQARAAEVGQPPVAAAHVEACGRPVLIKRA
ncbi:MAG: hypothetical protein A2W31_17740 [Planctomycetes bacterium RBG_16_64_10]|nr:MAG: hypothetical protein A2W31_17740 [Planctomycetes bacterium RBG_16_64_10]